MNTRTGQLSSFPLGNVKNDNLRKVLIIGLIVAALMTYVGGKVQIMRLGYRIEELEKQKRGLERENRALQIETSSLEASSRIEEIAIKRLGMVRPPKENIVVVRRKSAAAPR